ncbi:MAG: hypothetical protein ABFD96_04090 [Armatimonadia bacterium]
MWLLIGIPALILTVAVIAATLGASRYDEAAAPVHHRHKVTELPVATGHTPATRRSG